MRYTVMFRTIWALTILLIAFAIKIWRWPRKGSGLAQTDKREANIPSLLDATLDDLANGLSQSRFTSVHLVQAYNARIAEVNDVFHAVIELNPDAESIAHALDLERRKAGPRSILHGIPFLLKDNIVTLDKTEATSGSSALLETRPPTEAGIVKQLRKAGAVILGRANLSEFAGFRYSNASTGWSPRGGQATGIFYPNMKASGSSTGSAISVGLGLTFASFGTETVASLVSPSEKSCVVGFKPTAGVLPLDGIIPVSRRQDAVGPIARSVKDIAHILDATSTIQLPSTSHNRDSKYATACRGTGLRNVRIGVVRHPKQDADQAKEKAFRKVLAMFRGAGATIVDRVTLVGLEEYEELPSRMKDIVLHTEFKISMEEYLKSLTANPRNILTFEKLIDAIKNEPSEMFPDRKVDVMQNVLNTDANSSDYRDMLRKEEYYANEGGFEGALNRHDCTVLIAPAGSLTLQTFAAMGGTPVMTVPMGFYPDGTKVKHDEKRGGLISVAPGIPFSLFMYGRRHGDAELLRVAHAFEQLSQVRREAKPYMIPKTDLKDFVLLGAKLS